VRDTITPWDLLAVQCLSVTVPTSVALDLVEGRLGKELGAFLRDVPTDVALGEGDAVAHLQDEAASDRAWDLLEEQDGVGWVTAGKLLARKRPHLIPVWDGIVRCAFGGPRDDAWLWLDGLIRGNDYLRDTLDQLRESPGLPALSRIRALDVVVWMRHRDGHRVAGCEGLGL
jgi:hypothetical protein